VLVSAPRRVLEGISNQLSGLVVTIDWCETRKTPSVGRNPPVEGVREPPQTLRPENPQRGLSAEWPDHNLLLLFGAGPNSYRPSSFPDRLHGRQPCDRRSSFSGGQLGRTLPAGPVSNSLCRTPTQSAADIIVFRYPVDINQTCRLKALRGVPGRSYPLGEQAARPQGHPC